MAREIDIYPGVVYEGVSGRIYVVADQSPSDSKGQPQSESDTPWWFSYNVNPSDNPWKLNALRRGTDGPDVIHKLLSPLSRDEMASLIDVSDLSEGDQERFRQLLLHDLDTSAAKGPRRIIAPNLKE